MSKVFVYCALALFVTIGALLSIALNFDCAILISIFTLLMLLAVVVSGKGFFSPITIFVLTAVPYLIAAPVDIYFYDNEHLFQKEYISWLVISGVVLLLSFMFVCEFSKSLRFKVFTVEAKVNIKIISLAYFVLYLIYLLMIATYFSLNIGSLSRADIYASKPTLFDVSKMILYSFTIAFFWYIFVVEKKKFLHSKLALIPLLMLVLTDTLILGDRKMALILILVLAFFYSVNHKIPKKAMIGFLALGFGFWILGFVRNLAVDQWGTIYSSLEFSKLVNPANVEFGAFSIIWQDYFSKGAYEFKATYLEMIVQIIPSFIYPDRPVPPSVDFVAKFYPAIHASGGGLAFNAILESIMNFYWFGPIIAGAGFGYLFRFYNEKNTLGVLVGGVLIYTFAFMMRNDMVSMLRNIIFCSVIILFFLVVFCKLSYRK